MPNKYCNLDGGNKIKDEYSKINTGFTTVETDMGAVNLELDNHKNSDNPAHPASKITNDSSNVQGSKVSDALDSIDNRIDEHVQGIDEKHNSSDIIYSGSIIGASNVKEALEDIDSKIDNIITGQDLDPNKDIEITNARQSSVKNKTYTVLGDRLDMIESGLYVNVKDHGLLGDNSNNDAIQLNTLLNAIGSTPTDLYLSDGVYLIDSDVTIPDNIALHFSNNSYFKTGNGKLKLYCGIGNSNIQKIFEGTRDRITLLTDTLSVDSNNNGVPDGWGYIMSATSGSSEVSEDGVLLTMTSTDSQWQSVKIITDNMYDITPNTKYRLKITSKFTKTVGEPYSAYQLRFYNSNNEFVSLISNVIDVRNVPDFETKEIIITIPNDENISKATLTLYIQTNKLEGGESGKAYFKDLEFFKYDYSIIGKPKIGVCYAEWFGAVVDDQNVDSTIAINLSLNLSPKVQLNDGVYYVSEVVLNNYNNLTGKGFSTKLKRIPNSSGDAVLNTVPGCLSFDVYGLVLDGNDEDCHCFNQTEFLSLSGEAGLERQYSFVYMPKLTHVSAINARKDGFHCKRYTKISMRDCVAREVGGWGIYHKESHDSTFADCGAYITGLGAFHSGLDDRVNNFKCWHNNQDYEADNNDYAVVLISSCRFHGYIEEVPYGALSILDSSNYVDCFFNNVGTNYFHEPATHIPKEKSLLLIGGGGYDFLGWQKCYANYININWAMDILSNFPVKVENFLEVPNPAGVFENSINITRYKNPRTLYMANDIKEVGSIHPNNSFKINNTEITKVFSNLSGDINFNNYTSNYFTYPITYTVTKTTNKYTLNITDGLEEQPKDYGIWVTRDILLDYAILSDVVAGNIKYMHLEYEAHHGLSDNQAKMGLDILLRDVTNDKTLLRVIPVDTNVTPSKLKVYESDYRIFEKMREYNDTLVAEGGTYQLNLRFTFLAVANQSITSPTATVTFENAKIWFG
jgi:hypothetical protein